MLQWLRDNVRSLSWTLWVVIAAFIIFYIPDFISSRSGLPASAAASVGGEQVSDEEFRRAYRREVDRYRESLGEQFTPELLRQLQIPRQVLERLIANKILLIEARRLGLSVSDEELRRTILELPFLVDASGRFVGDEIYGRTVRRGLGYATVADFEQALREDLLREKLLAALADNLYVADAEVEAAHRREVERARVRYLEMPAARFASEVEVGAQEIAAFYDAQREAYRLPEQRLVSYLVVDAARVREGIEIPEDELEAFYQQHLDEFTQQEQVRARQILLLAGEERGEEETRAELAAIRRRIEGGEEFAALARELSEDPASRDRGGDLGYFARGTKVPAFEEAVFAAQPGELIGPLRIELVTGTAFHLVEVLERREGTTRTLAEVAGQIRFRLAQERSQAAGERRSAELAERLRSGPPTSAERLRELAAEGGEVSFAETPPFGRQDPVPGLGRVPAFNEAAWSLGVGQVSDPVRIPRGWAVLFLAEVREPRLPELAEVEDRVRQAVVERKQLELATAALAAARREVEAGGSLDAVAEAAELEVVASEEFGHGGTIPGLAAGPAVVAAALGMGEGELGGPLASGQGAVLFEVTARTTWDPAEFESRRQELRSALEQQKLQQLLAAVVEARRRDLVTYDPQILDELNQLEAGP